MTFLGTGGAFTDFRVNYHNNVFIQSEGGNLLVDCGGTAVQSLKELGVPLGDVGGVYITHMHGDHVGGLEQLLWERFYTGKMFQRTRIYGHPEVLRGVRQMLTPCVDEYTNFLGQTRHGGFDALVEECSLSNFIAFSCVPRRMRHVTSEKGVVNKPSFGLELGGTAFFTSDATFDPELYKEYPRETIFHDCTFGPRYSGTVHTHYSELLTLSPKDRARTVLMHYTQVPTGFDPVKDGFRVAHKHEQFIL